MPKKSFSGDHVDSGFVEEVEDVRNGGKLGMVNAKLAELQKAISDASISMRILVSADGRKNFEAIASLAKEILEAAEEAVPLARYRFNLSGK